MGNNVLKSYLEDTLLINVNEFFAVRISSPLKDSLDHEILNEAINEMGKIAFDLGNLNLQFPSNKKPKFYAYIVPNENFKDYLDFPKQLNANGGGKPVKCFEEDGLKRAYGMSANRLQGFVNPPIIRHINHIHEFAHLIQSEFFIKGRLLGEGFADAFCFYTLGYENVCPLYNQTICQLKSEEIFSANMLMEFDRDGSFDFKGNSLQNKSCSFRLSYISSYLFVRACMEKIAEINNCDRLEATQKFLDMMLNINSFGFNMLFEIALKLGFDKDIFINTNQEQLKLIKNIKIKNNIKTGSF